MKNEQTSRLRPFKHWLAESGFSSVTGWRMRKAGMIETLNVCGRLYVTDESVQRFMARAAAGEFAKRVQVPLKRAATATAK